jgi:hypothetical protein
MPSDTLPQPGSHTAFQRSPAPPAEVGGLRPVQSGWVNCPGHVRAELPDPDTVSAGNHGSCHDLSGLSGSKSTYARVRMNIYLIDSGNSRNNTRTTRTLINLNCLFSSLMCPGHPMDPDIDPDKAALPF